MTRPFGVLLLAPLLLAPLSGGTAWAQQDSCHLHAPGDFPSFSRQPLVIPAVGDPAACERLNRERFGGAGRCHCGSDGPGGERLRAAPFSQAPESIERLP
jgi:hypothetical protein